MGFTDSSLDLERHELMNDWKGMTENDEMIRIWYWTRREEEIAKSRWRISSSFSDSLSLFFHWVFSVGKKAYQFLVRAMKETRGFDSRTLKDKPFRLRGLRLWLRLQPPHLIFFFFIISSLNLQKQLHLIRSSQSNQDQEPREEEKSSSINLKVEIAVSVSIYLLLLPSRLISQ